MKKQWLSLLAAMLALSALMCGTALMSTNVDEEVVGVTAEMAEIQVVTATGEMAQTDLNAEINTENIDAAKFLPMDTTDTHTDARIAKWETDAEVARDTTEIVVGVTTDTTINTTKL